MPLPQEVGDPGWSSPRREVCPSRTPTGHCEETWCLPAAGHSLARIGSLVPGSDLVLDRLWCRGRRPLGTATCVASSSLPICPTLPARRHRVVTCFIIFGTHHHHHHHQPTVVLADLFGHQQNTCVTTRELQWCGFKSRCVAHKKKTHPEPMSRQRFMLVQNWMHITNSCTTNPATAAQRELYDGFLGQQCR